MGFLLDQDTAIHKRLTTSVDAWHSKSVYEATWNEYVWYLTPMWTNNQSVWIDRFWQARKFETNQPCDVIESDILVIDNVEYQVKSFAPVKWITIKRVRVILTLPKNW